jgi:RNA polymerase sigma factor (sigma-70 family)
MSLGEVSDERLRALMREAQAGNREAYVLLLSAIAPKVRRIVRARRGFLGADEVEDLVQDVLLSLHAVRATYDSSRPFAPWLLAIVRHRLADAARRYARQKRHEVAWDEDEVTLADVAANGVDEGPGDPEALAEAIRALPPGQRQAIELLKLRELSLREASAATGLSVGALKLATHRAMHALRRALRTAQTDED